MEQIPSLATSQSGTTMSPSSALATAATASTASTAVGSAQTRVTCANPAHTVLGRQHYLRPGDKIQLMRFRRLEPGQSSSGAHNATQPQSLVSSQMQTQIGGAIEQGSDEQMEGLEGTDKEIWDDTCADGGYSYAVYTRGESAYRHGGSRNSEGSEASGRAGTTTFLTSCFCRAPLNSLGLIPSSFPATSRLFTHDQLLAHDPTFDERMSALQSTTAGIIDRDGQPTEVDWGGAEHFDIDSDWESPLHAIEARGKWKKGARKMEIKSMIQKRKEVRSKATSAKSATGQASDVYPQAAAASNKRKAGAETDADLDANADIIAEATLRRTRTTLVSAPPSVSVSASAADSAMEIGVPTSAPKSETLGAGSALGPPKAKKARGSIASRLERMSLKDPTSGGADEPNSQS